MRQDGPYRILVRGFVQRTRGDRTEVLQSVAQWIATVIASDDIDTLLAMGREFGLRSSDLLPAAGEQHTEIPEDFDPRKNPIFSAAMVEEIRVALTEAITRVVDEEIARYRPET